jgi:hypothetical protein
MGVYLKWTSVQDERLINLLQTKRIKEIADIFKISEAAVKNRKARLKYNFDIPYLSLFQFRKENKLSKTSVLNLIKTGKLKVIKFRRNKYFIEKPEFEKWKLFFKDFIPIKKFAEISFYSISHIRKMIKNKKLKAKKINNRYFLNKRELEKVFLI